MFSRFLRLTALTLTGALMFCFGQTFRVLPSRARQGELLQVYATDESMRATFLGRTILLFAEEGSILSRAGLMPIPVRTKPGSYPLQWLNQQGSVLHTTAIQVMNAHYPTQNVQLPQSLSELKSTPEERSEVSAFLKQESVTRYGTLPIQAPLQSCLTSLFGVQRMHNGVPTGDFHGGLDQRGATGTPIHAVAAGTVRLSGQFALHGGTVGIDHGQGLKSMYLHMSRIVVTNGERVCAGQVVGSVGSTGRSTGSHLHWSLYAQGEPVNPLQWVNLRQCVSRPVKKRRMH